MQPAGRQRRKRSLRSCSKQTPKVRLSPRCSPFWQLLLALRPSGAARSICKGKDTLGMTAGLSAIGLERDDENRCHILFLMSLSSPDHGLLSAPLSLPLPLLYLCFPSLSGSLLFPGLDLDQPFLALRSGCTPKTPSCRLHAPSTPLLHGDQPQPRPSHPAQRFGVCGVRGAFGESPAPELHRGWGGSTWPHGAGWKLSRDELVLQKQSLGTNPAPASVFQERDETFRSERKLSEARNLKNTGDERSFPLQADQGIWTALLPFSLR